MAVHLAHMNSTLAQQLALYITMYSPLQMAADLPKTYEKFLETEPGDFITYARKKKGSENWFVGRTKDETARTSKINFNFLPEGRRYIATIHSDKKDAHTEPIHRLMRLRNMW